jgi:hypothetical protein
MRWAPRHARAPPEDGSSAATVIAGGGADIDTAAAVLGVALDQPLARVVRFGDRRLAKLEWRPDAVVLGVARVAKAVADADASGGAPSVKI